MKTNNIINEAEASGSHYKSNTGKDTVDELYDMSTEAGFYFCYGNIKKYLNRLGKKGNTVEERSETMKKDLYKIAKYACLILEHEFRIKYDLVKSTYYSIDDGVSQS